MPNTLPPTPQGFDEWSALAKSDPQAFETQRSLVIENAIRRAPATRQQRLRCLQWRLDQIRATSRTPMVACLRMNRLLWEAVGGRNGLLACLQRPAVALSRPTNSGGPAAQIIPFRRHI